MVSQAQYAWVDRRLRQGTAVDEPFGGISVVMTGDLGQLQPVGGSPLYKQNPTAALNVEGYAAYSGSRTSSSWAELSGRRPPPPTTTTRGASSSCCRVLVKDWELLLKRQPNSLTADEKAEFKDATRLFFSKREVNKCNGKLSLIHI